MTHRKLIQTLTVPGIAGMLALGASIAQADTTWDGSTSASWLDGGNWGGTAPTSTDIAVFNSTSYTNQPVLDVNTVPAVLGLQLGGTSAAALAISTTTSADAGQITSGSTPNGSTTITLADASGTVVGQMVTGTRIAVGTFVTAISGNQITLSQPTVGGTLNSGTQLTFYSSLKIGSGGVTVGADTSGLQNIGAPVVLAGNQTWTNNSAVGDLDVTGNSGFFGEIYLGSNTLTLSGVAGSSTNFRDSGALNGTGSLIIDTAGSVGFGKSTGGRPTNPFTGGVTLNAGTLNISGGNSGGGGGAGALGTGILTINGGEINGGGNIAGHPLTISGQVWNADWAFLSSKRLEMGTGAITLGTAPGTTRTVTISNYNNVWLEIGGVISNGTTANSLTKAGIGKMLLNAANLYTGATTISNGILALGASGSIAASSTINIAAGATFDVSAVIGGYTIVSGQTLTGTGTVLGDLIVADGGILAPGNSPGTLNTGTLALNNASVLDFQFDSLAGPNDLIAVTGDLTLDGILNIADLGGLEIGQYTLLTYTGELLADNTLSLGAAPGEFGYSIDTATPGSVFLNVTAIPEPATFALLCLGGVMLAGARRRHN